MTERLYGRVTEWKTKSQRQVTGVVSPRPPEILGNDEPLLVAYIWQ